VRFSAVWTKISLKMTTLKQPPIFNSNGGDSYMNWKSDIEIWQLFTKEESKRLGPAVYLNL
jgi:hypothetical protein